MVRCGQLVLAGFGRWLGRAQMCTATPPQAVRVRFAPSPTGDLHLGGLRTALYNYLFARSSGGRFIVRIEDTDQARLVPEAMDKLIDTLEWSGIEIDEGPYRDGDFGPYTQSERISTYWEMIQKLLQNGSAYHCFCSPSRLELLRKDAMRRGEVPRYDNRCRHMNPVETEKKLKLNTPYVIRFKLEEFKEPWHDMVYGPIIHDVCKTEGDTVLLKSDRFPTYHFANVVDDHLMQISHVLRGLEWQVSTSKHILLYSAFGWQPPKFGHLPLLLNKDGSKLSKRQNDIHVDYLRHQGFSPEAVLNLLTQTGGSGFGNTDTHGMRLSELVEHFDLATLTTNSTRLDLSRLKALNQAHLAQKLEGEEREEIIEQLRDLIQQQFSERNGSSALSEDSLTDEYIGNVLDWAKDRITMIEQLVSTDYEFLWLIPSQLSVASLADSDNILQLLQWTLVDTKMLPAESFTRDKLNRYWKQFTKMKNLKFSSYMKVLRTVISGLEEGPAVAEMMVVLGKDATIKRLQLVIDMLHKHLQDEKHKHRKKR